MQYTLLMAFGFRIPTLQIGQIKPIMTEKQPIELKTLLDLKYPGKIKGFFAQSKYKITNVMRPPISHPNCVFARSFWAEPKCYCHCPACRSLRYWTASGIWRGNWSCDSAW